MKDWQIRLKNLWTTWTKLEYLPIYIINIPVMCFYLLFALKSRALFFFSASNPGVQNGGFFGESKGDLLKQLPDKWKPRSVYLSGHESRNQAWNLIKDAGIALPFIAKPDEGERGYLVSKIRTETGFDHYLTQIGRRPYIIQEFVSHPLEMAVHHSKTPDQSAGVISSLCEKQPLTVTGDGQSNVKQLIMRKERARLQYFDLKPHWNGSLDQIPKQGEVITLQEIGNHCRGALFLNRNEWIDQEMVHTFDSVNDTLDQLHFTRYDLKTPSIGAMKRGEFKIIEINCAGGEPAHVYHPGTSARSFYGDMYKHWRSLYRVSKRMHEQFNIPYLHWRTGIRLVRSYFANRKAQA